MGFKERFFDGKNSEDEAEIRRIRQQMHDRDYFVQLKKMYPEIESVYYPAAGEDYTEFKYVENEMRVVTVDAELTPPYPRRDKMQNYIKADMEKSPFRDEAFDAVFIQDADTDKFGDVFRTLKLGGIFVFSKDDCGPLFNMDPWEFDRMPGFERIEGPETHLPYYVFRKTGHVGAEDFE